MWAPSRASGAFTSRLSSTPMPRSRLPNCMTARMRWWRPTCSMIVFFPFMREHDVRLLRVLTDRGTEYCGNRESHEYQLYLAVEDIDHTRTRTKSPQTNGICERFHRTVQEEFYSVAFRKKLYTTLEQLQLDLDTWLREYNQEREHSGKYCFGKTPMQTFLDSTHLAKEKMLDRLTVGDASDTAGLRAAPERSPQQRSAGAARLTAG